MVKQIVYDILPEILNYTETRRDDKNREIELKDINLLNLVHMM